METNEINLTSNDFYDKRRVAYELINSAIDLFLLNDSRYNLTIYNSAFTAWNLLYEMKWNWKNKENKTFNLTLEKEKMYIYNKSKDQDVNKMWNFIKHAKKEPIDSIFAGDMVAVNFHLLFNVCQDFLRVNSIIKSLLNFPYDIKKLKIYSLVYIFLNKNSDKNYEQFYNQCNAKITDHVLFSKIEKIDKESKDEFELLEKVYKNIGYKYQNKNLISKS